MSCDNMKPYACGGSMNPNTVQNPCDRSLHFEGADDVTINQGVGIDLTEGVHAYDAHGNEIEYTVEPESIEKCEVGDHVITYTATGEGSRSVPTMCGETALYTRACNIITEIKKRIITILQSANPIIRGLSDVLIQPDETFAPLSGVTSEDANGNELTVSYSGRYTNTAEGDIATFDTPYAEPMVSLVADIDPIQDLHGYDRPWVGGGNGNLFKVTPYRGGYNYSAGTSLKVDTDVMDYEITSDGKISINITTAWRGRLFATDALEAGDYTFRCYGDISGIRASWYITDSDLNVVELVANQQNQGWGSTYTRTITQGQRIALHLGANAVTTLVTEFQVNTGTTIQPIVPFENICPISGWDSVDVTRTGKNLFDADAFFGAYGGIKQDDGSWRVSNLNSIYHKVCFENKDGYTGRFALTWIHKDNASSPTFGAYFQAVYTDGTTQNMPMAKSADAFRTETAITRADKVVDYIWINYSSNGESYYYGQIEIGETATSYEPYQGTTITATLPQTVYGGTLDVVSGVLTVDMKYDQMTYAYLSSLTSSYISFASNITQVGGNAVWVRNWNYTDYPATIDGGIKAKCNAFPISMHNKTIFSSQYRTYFGVGSMTSVDEFLSAVQTLETSGNGLWIAHELATPTTIQLTPTQIDSLLGRNSVWADSGDVTVWYVDEIPQSAFSYPVRGKYTIMYTAEDECGNRTENDRTIQVGEETFRTVIYEDKTLIINERSSDIEENERLHRRAEYVYDAMDNDHPYVFSSPEDVPWNYVAGYPERVEFGSEVHPTSTAYWFYYMNQVNTFDFTNLDTSNVTDMKYMFYGCEHILNLAPELDTSNVTDMSHMFERCIATPEIDVSSFDTSNVTDMSSMFASCYNLRAIYAKPIFVTDNVISSNLMFGYDAHLVGGMGTPYDSNYEDKTYARIDDLPQTKGYFTDKDHITEWFRTAIHYDGTLIINESSLDQATNRELHGDAVAVYPPLDADHDYVFYTTLGGGSPYDVYWYQNRNNIKSVKIGSPIKPTNTAFWFNACDKITEMDFTNMDTSDVTEMGWMFFGCSKLNGIEFGDSFDTGNVFNFVGMFQACSELESVDLSGFDTSSATLMGSMFNSDSSLKTIYASDAFVTDNVTSSSDMFSGCTSLVGGSGTVYDQNKTDDEYARIDNPPDEPGYFTQG